MKVTKPFPLDVAPVVAPLSDYEAVNFLFETDGPVATITLNRPERKNPMTFKSYREMADLFHALGRDETIKVVIVTGAGGNFSSGGDVFDIIGPLLEMNTRDLLKFTRMTGELIQAMRKCPQPVVAAIDGICVGAGAAIAMASDLRIGTPRAKVAFLFNKVGLAGCDMGACAMLPRIIGQGRASELLFTGRPMTASEGEAWGFFNRLADPDALASAAGELARMLADGPTFAMSMTKRMLAQEWAMSVDEAIEAEATAQALCMTTEDFGRAYKAFADKTRPVFEGN